MNEFQVEEGFEGRNAGVFNGWEQEIEGWVERKIREFKYDDRVYEGEEKEDDVKERERGEGETG